MPALAVRCAVAAVAVFTSLLVPFAGAAAAGTGTTVLRITTPASVPAGSDADVWLRLVRSDNGGEEPIGDKPVVVQRKSSSGWSKVAGFTTRADGLAHGPVAVGSTGRYRAFFRGDAVNGTATSREVVISATTLGDRAIAEAKRHRGAPYAAGAAGPSRFDCSGLTMYVFRRLGRNLPHNSSQQAGATHRVANSAKRAGDLIFTYHGSRIGHVGIYAGGSQMWASVQAGDVVRLQSFSGRTYSVGRVA
jgi:cell wall-associated NlpC family hydrolase